MKNISIDEVYFNLSKNNQLHSIITFSDEKITIHPYSNLNIEIIKTDYFDVYINQTLYYSIESEEIIDFILDFVNEKFYFVEQIYRTGRKKIKTLTKVEYLKKALNLDNTSVYSIKKKLL